jgi:hypothetical protein
VPRVLSRMAVLACAAAAVGGCGGGSVDREEAERFLERDLGQVTGVRGIAVACPDDVEDGDDVRFACRARARDRTAVDVRVARGEDGALLPRARVLRTRDVERQIAMQLGRGVAVDCPDLVDVAQPRVFRCRGRDDDAEGAIRVRTSLDGRFTFRFLRQTLRAR